jgi:hypothetical protein
MKTLYRYRKIREIHSRETVLLHGIHVPPIGEDMSSSLCEAVCKVKQ